MPEKTATLRPEKVDTDALLPEYAPMIRMIAQRLAFRLPPTLDVDDLIHVGVIGLMKALDRYDPSINARFKTYAEFRVRGAMLDEIRALDWVPRSVRDKASRLRKACDIFIKKWGRPPAEEELIDLLKMTQKTFDHFIRQVSGGTLLSLEDLGVQGGSEWAFVESLADPNSEDPLLALLSNNDRERLIDAIESLPEKERLVISLYYDKELTMKEIGVVLNVTESRVCQLHTKAILRLKGLIGKER